MGEATYSEHIAWCKKRALEYLDEGDVGNAVASMLSDLSKHPETRGVGEKMAPVGLFYVTSFDEAGARRFIEGFTE